jgi:hypothetical protein
MDCQMRLRDAGHLRPLNIVHNQRSAMMRSLSRTSVTSRKTIKLIAVPNAAAIASTAPPLQCAPPAGVYLSTCRHWRRAFTPVQFFADLA